MAQLKGHKLDSKWYNTVTLFPFKLTGSYIRQNLWQNSPHINITLQNIRSVPCCLEIRSMGALKGRKRLEHVLHKTDTKELINITVHVIKVLTSYTLFEGRGRTSRSPMSTTQEGR